MDGSHFQKVKVEDSKISGYVWTGPISVKTCLDRLWPLDVSSTATKRIKMASDQMMTSS